MTIKFMEELNDVLSREADERPEWRIAQAEYVSWLGTPAGQATSELNQKLELLRRAVEIFSAKLLEDKRVIELVTQGLPAPGSQIMLTVGSRPELVRVVDRVINARLAVEYVLERPDGSRFRYAFAE